MSNLDSSKVTAVIAVAAIFSPIITAAINNIFQLFMKLMDNKEKNRERTTDYKRKIIESYLRSIGQYINSCSMAKANDYKETYLLALMYVPKTIREKMIHIDNLLNTDEDEAQKMVEQLIPEIEQLLGKL